MNPPPRNISLQTGSRLAHCFDACTLHRKALLVLGLGIVLSACGGGGGSGGSSGSNVGTGSINGSSTFQPTPPLSSNPYAAIAEAKPKAGSVTQSSRAVNGITLDSVSATVNSGSVSVTNGNWTMTFTDSANNGPNLFDVSYSPVSGPIKASQAEIDWLKRNKKKFSMGCTNCSPLPRGFSAGNGRYVYGGGQLIGTDYMVMGVWAITNSSVLSSSSFLNPDEIGIYVDGGETFKPDNITSLTGGVSYNGPVQAHIYPNNRSIGQDDIQTVYGYVNLGANFDTADELGFVSGSMSGFHTQADYFNSIQPRAYSGTLVLEESRIGDSHSGFFNGDVSGTLDGKVYNGNYGGQFYLNDDPSGLPGRVAGTMAAKSNDNFTIISTWAAEKQ